MTDHASSYNHQPVVTKATGDTLKESIGLGAVRRSKEEGCEKKGAADNPSNQTYPQALFLNVWKGQVQILSTIKGFH